MKAMIIGATGLLGKPLMRECTGAELTGTGSRDLDIRDARAVRDLIEKKHPDWIVLPPPTPTWMGARATPSWPLQ